LPVLFLSSGLEKSGQHGQGSSPDCDVESDLASLRLAGCEPIAVALSGEADAPAEPQSALKGRVHTRRDEILGRQSDTQEPRQNRLQNHALDADTFLICSVDQCFTYLPVLGGRLYVERSDVRSELASTPKHL
jgi:hypothetical protein